MIFAYPYLFLLLAVPFILYFLLPAARGLHGDALRVPFLKDIQNINIKSGGFWTMGGNFKISRNFFILLAIFALLVTAAARPQKIGDPIQIRAHGRDILLVVDLSGSMLNPDLSYNGYSITRLEAVKTAAYQFIENRMNDRIGLILFGTRAYLQAPLTFDRKSIQEILMEADAGMAGNSTAIGDALGLALKSLKDSKDLDKKVIILLTDGESNDGSVSLPYAISLASRESVRVYTIGVGGHSAIMGFFGLTSQELDEKTLKEIAEATKAHYYRAASASDLIKIYNKIDEIEPTAHDSNVVKETTDLFYIPLLAALLLSTLWLIMLMRNRS